MARYSLLLEIMMPFKGMQMQFRIKEKFGNTDLRTVLDHLWKYTQVIGQKVAYAVLLMVFAFRRKETPRWARNIIIGALAYFLSPIDSIPDLTPILGYTDDFGVLSFGLVTIASYINDDVRIEARKIMKKIFGKLDFESIQCVDRKL